jgi:hypothetical protein
VKYFDWLLLAFVAASVVLAAYATSRHLRTRALKKPSRPALESQDSGAVPAPISIPSGAPANTKDSLTIVKEALRQGDSAAADTDGPSLPFLDTSPLTYQGDDVADPPRPRRP